MAIQWFFILIINCSYVYKSSTNKPLSVLLTVATSLARNPFTALSHFLLLKPESAFILSSSAGDCFLSNSKMKMFFLTDVFHSPLKALILNFIV